MTRSILDEYLPGYARERFSGSRQRVALRDMGGLRDRIDRAKRLPWGERQRALRVIADDFGVSLRTLDRYARHQFHLVELAGWRAMFRVGSDGRPVQSSAWERIR